MSELRFSTQPEQLPVKNFDDLVKDDLKVKRHGNLLPSSIRALVCGPSNCGKTNSVLALLTHPNGIRFENVYVFSKSLNQSKYTFLERLLSSVKGIGYFKFNEHEQVISPDEVKPNSVFLFDDLVGIKNLNHIRSYFCMGRHKLVDCFYLCQTYACIPKHLIRDNTNFLILFKQDEMNMKHVLPRPRYKRYELYKIS